ncbi:MAG: transcription elongation factor GreB [Burkholderiaceae bacterium]
MNKAFVRETEDDDEELDGVVASPLPIGAKNYITPQGYAALRAELFRLLDIERPEMVRVVSWAASNGDRSENGDYLYGKKRLREIDRRIRFLTKRLDIAEVVDAGIHRGSDQVFFGATVDYLVDDAQHTITIVGIDEAEPLEGRVSWVAPISRALVKARVGDVVTLRTPGGVDEIEILEVRYPEKQAD